MEAFARAELLWGREAMEKLEKAHVAVFGVGGVGAACCEALVRGGVGRLSFFDPDGVSVTNLNRQLVALHSTVGKNKAEVMKEREERKKGYAANLIYLMTNDILEKGDLVVIIRDNYDKRIGSYIKEKGVTGVEYYPTINTKSGFDFERPEEIIAVLKDKSTRLITNFEEMFEVISKQKRAPKPAIKGPSTSPKPLNSEKEFAKKLLDLMNGTIDVKSRYGEGKETVYKAHEGGALPRDVIPISTLAGGAALKERAIFCN